VSAWISPSSGLYTKQTVGIMQWHVNIQTFVVFFSGIRHHNYHNNKIAMVKGSLLRLKIIRNFFFTMAQQPLIGQGLLIIMITLRHTTIGRTPLDEWSAGRRELYLTTHNTHKRHIHTTGGIRTHNPTKRAAADSRLRPYGPWDRH
jgi:hypothetical protein